MMTLVSNTGNGDPMYEVYTEAENRKHENFNN